MAEPTKKFTPWRGRFNSDVIVGKSAANLVRILPLTGFDGRGVQSELDLGYGIADTLNEISRSSKAYGRRRPSDPTGRYRHVKLMSVRVPGPTSLPAGQKRELAVAQRPWLANIEQLHTVAAISVQLREQTGLRARRAKEAVHEAGRSLAFGSITPARVEKDRREMLSATSRAGCATPTEDDWRMLLGWYSRGGVSNPPLIFHFDHLHIFSPAAWQDLKFEKARGTVVTFEDCCDWPADLPGHHVLAFGSVASFTGTNRDEGFDDTSVAVPVTGDQVKWVTAAHDLGAWACTATFFLEPGRVAAKGLEDNRARVDADMERLAAKGQWQKDEHEKQLQHIADARAYYAIGNHAVAINVSGLVAMPLPYPWHEGYDWAAKFSGTGVTVAPVQTEHEVMEAFTEMQLGSDNMCAPQPGELSTEWLGFSQFSRTAVASERKGIYLGSTVDGSQPCWLDMDDGVSFAAPFHLIQGATGAGKSTLLSSIITQATIEGRGGLVANFKEQDLSYKLMGEILAAMGYPVNYYSLDDLRGADGPFDQFKLRKPVDPKTATPEAIAKAGMIVKGAGVRAAVQIMKVNPWSEDRKSIPAGAETMLKEWLTAGENAGARCVGEALRPYRDQRPDIIDPILSLASTDDMFRMFVGLNPDSPSWSTSGGLTIIERGLSSIPFPDNPHAEWGNSERAAVGFMQAFIQAAGFGLAYQGAFMAVDEVWAVSQVASQELTAAGRLWRLLGVYLVVTDQKMTGMEPLAQFASRVTVGFNKSDEEAASALTVAGAAVTNSQIGSMKSWKVQLDEDDETVLRGAYWLHRDVREGLTLIEQIPNPAWQVTTKQASAESMRGG